MPKQREMGVGAKTGSDKRFAETSAKGLRWRTLVSIAGWLFALLVVNGSANFQNLTGTGESGLITYYVVGKSVVGFNGPLIFAPGAALVDHAVRPQRWIATGSADNRKFDANVIFVFNANGELVAVKLDNIVSCVG